MNRSCLRFSALGVVGLSVLAAGCAGGADPVPGEEWDSDVATASLHLTAVGSCAEVEQAVRDAAYQDVKQRLYAQMMDWLENGESRCDYQDDMYASGEGDMASAGPGGSTDDGGSPDEVSETNNQVEGVDEADFLKTDEDGFIYVLSGDSLHVVEAWPAAEADRIGSLAIEGTPKKLFVRGNLALVYSSLVEENQQVCDEYGCYDSGGYGYGECTYGYGCVPQGDGNPTKITVLDLSDKTNPVVVRELRSNGSLLAARRIDDVVHTVVSLHGPQFPVENYVDISCDGEEAPDAGDIIDAFTEVLLANKKIIEETPVSAVLPALADSATEAGDELASCPAFFRGRVNAGSGFTTLISFPMSTEVAPSASTVVSDPGAVYASGESLYMAVPQYSDSGYGWYEGYDATPELSVVHRFALEADGTSSYQASGAVAGHVLNQFAMDEYESHLRIATTTGYVGQEGVHSTLSVLEQRGVDLAIAGVVDGIAPGEDIRSVRFAGDRGFVVTFKKTDPLFVFDLAEPATPRILSELKIPGFSTYMHMMDDTHLLTIGYDADDQGDFAYFDGVMLQIFDVSNPLDPQLAHKEIIGTRGSSSEALNDHLAFNYFAPKDLLALPMTICEGGDEGNFGDQLTFSGLMVYDVTVESGFALRGKLAFPMAEPVEDPYGGEASCNNWWTDASSVVKRSVVMDDFVYGITDTLIQVSSLDAVEAPVGSVDLAAPAE